MARFEIAEKITGRNEGGYANNPADTGGETYAGIARNHWPKWDGWVYIDRLKSEYPKYKANLNKNLTPYNLAKFINVNAPNQLSNDVSEFYKQNFWDVNKLDLIQDQQLANTVYDFGVNSGTSRSAKFLQWAYNNLQTFNGANLRLVEDGKIGSDTLKKVNSCNGKELYGCYNALRDTFYRSIAKGNQAQFLKSWLSRLKSYTK